MERRLPRIGFWVYVRPLRFKQWSYVSNWELLFGTPSLMVRQQNHIKHFDSKTQMLHLQGVTGELIPAHIAFTVRLDKFH